MSRSATASLKARFKNALPNERPWFVPSDETWGRAPSIVIVCGLAVALFGFLANNLICLTSWQPAIQSHAYLQEACEQVKAGHQAAQAELVRDVKVSSARKDLLVAALATQTQGDVRAYLEREQAEEERLRAFKRMFVTIIPWGWYALAQFLLVAVLAFGVLIAIWLLSASTSLIRMAPAASGR